MKAIDRQSLSEQEPSVSELYFSRKLKSGEKYEIKANHRNTFLFVIGGSIILSHKGDQIIHINGKQFILLPERLNYQIVATQLTDIMYITFENDENEWVCSMLRKLIPDSNSTCFSFGPLDLNHILLEYLNSLKYCFHKELFSRYLYQIKQKEFFFLFSKTYTLEEQLQMFCPMILRRTMDFRQFVLNNYLKIKTVPEFATLGGYSQSSFKRKFKEHFDESVYNWLQKKKAENILSELHKDNSDYKTIMKKFNFSSYNSFSKFCKKFLGETPPTIKAKTYCNQPIKQEERI